MRMYQFTANPLAVAAVYEEHMDLEHDPLTREYEAWAVTAYGIERIYIARKKLEQCCIGISEEEAMRMSPALLETLRIARPDDVRPAHASPHFTCEHGEGCLLAEHSQSQLWRDAQQTYAQKALCSSTSERLYGGSDAIL